MFTSPGVAPTISNQELQVLHDYSIAECAALLVSLESAHFTTSAQKMGQMISQEHMRAAIDLLQVCEAVDEKMMWASRVTAEWYQLYPLSLAFMVNFVTERVSKPQNDASLSTGLYEFAAHLLGVQAKKLHKKELKMRELVQARDEMTDLANDLDGTLRSERDGCTMQTRHNHGRCVPFNTSNDLADLQIKYHSAQEELKDLREKTRKSEAALEAVMERFQCGLCNERMVDRVSSCGHTLCEPCSTNWAETCKPHDFTCPMCRKPGDNITFTVVYYVG